MLRIKPSSFLRSIIWLFFLLSACVPAAPSQPTAVPQTPLPAAATATKSATLPPAAATSPATPPPASTATPASTPVGWKPFASGLKKPVDLAEIPDGSGRLLVVEQGGVIRVVSRAGELLPDPFMDLRDRVGANANEQGLLGLALHPNFGGNGYFYINYTRPDGSTVIARFTAGPGAAQADPKSEKILLQVKQPYPNHNGGGVAFGPDGYLYLALGDGGSFGDPQNRAQSPDTLLGKLLRIDVNQGDPYAAPPTNPYARGGGLPEIWAIGLRNPWRFSFDRLTGDLYIGDVGQDQWEEIDFLPAGSPGGTNFGWRYREGTHAYTGRPPLGVSLVDPVWEYRHDEGCSVTGGFVYRGQKFSTLQGTYIYGDYCIGTVWGLKRAANGAWQNQVFAKVKASISSFGQDLSGELYLLDHNGNILKLENT